MANKNLFNVKNSSLGEILLRVLETTPIQIAKIINDEFEIMSDWYFLDKKFEKNKESNLKTYLQNIKFGLKWYIIRYWNKNSKKFMIKNKGIITKISI